MATDTNSWQINFVTTFGVGNGCGDTDDVIGTSPQASDGFDSLDSIDLGGPGGDNASLSIVHLPTDPGFAGNPGPYNQDFRAPIAPSQSKTWNRIHVFTTSVDPTGMTRVTITWGDLGSFPSNLKFTWVSPVDMNGAPTVMTPTTVDMRAFQSFSYPATNMATQSLDFMVVVQNTAPPPAVQLTTGPTVAAASSNSVTFAFNTNVNAVATINYGPTSMYGSSISEMTAVSNHSVTVTGLMPSTVYHFQVVAKSPNATIASVTSPDLTAMTNGLITFTAMPVVSNLTSTTGSVSFAVSQAGSAVVSIGPDATHLTPGMAQSVTTAMQTLPITGLKPGQTYTLQVAVSAPNFDAATQTLTFTAPPTVSIQGMSPLIVDSNSVTISFTTDAPATATAKFSVDNTLSQSQAEQATTPGLSHTILITGLTPKTTYNYEILVDAGAAGRGTAMLPASGAPLQFTTPVPSVNVTDIQITSDATSITINWVTDVAATGKVEYGTTTMYGSEVSETGTPKTSHSLKIPMLTADTTYHLQLIATPINMPTLANFVGPDFVVTTSSTPILFTQTPAITNITATSAAVTFAANETGSALVEIGPDLTHLTSLPAIANATGAQSVPLTGLTTGSQYLVQVTVSAPGFAPAVFVTPLFTASNGTISFTQMPAVTNITATSASVNFTASQPGTALVEFGPDLTHLTSLPAIANATGAQSVPLTGLTLGNQYLARVTVSSPGFTSAVFVTPLFTAANPPIMFVATPVATSTTLSTATITFTTSLPPNTVSVDYGPTQEYGSNMPGVSGSTTQSIVLAGLNPGALYHFRVNAAQTGQMGIQSADQTFITESVLGLSVHPTVTTDQTTATISFETNTASTAVINYGTTSKYGQSSPTSTTRNVSHAITITGLASNTIYHFQIVAQAPNRVDLVTQDLTFLTAPNLLYGDLNGDGVVDEADAIITLKIAIGLRSATPLELLIGDVAPIGDPDGRITVADAAVILLRAFNMIGPLTGRRPSAPIMLP